MFTSGVSHEPHEARSAKPDAPHSDASSAAPYRKAPMTSWAPTIAKSSRIAASSKFVYHAL